MSLEPGQRLGHFEIIDPAGSGGMGEVYTARDTRLDRTVAIKVLPSHLSENEELRARFDREARTISNLSHPHICSLHDVGHEDGVDFLVMEYLEGDTLAERIADGPMPIDDVFRIGIEICGALDAAHRNGVVHRDLKPGNVMLTKSGAKLLDFGLAKLADTGGDVVQSTLTEMATQQHSGEPLTGQGTILGTFQYMPPEQLEGKEVDARADVFALGAILYEMATGRKAFDGGSQASLIAAILERTPPAISTIQPMTPPALDHVVRACLAKDPDERIQTAHDVRLQLQWIREGGSQVGMPAAVVSSRRRRGWIGWGAAAIFAVVAAALAALQLGRTEPPAVTLVADVAVSDGVDAIIHYGGGSFALSPDGRNLVTSAIHDDSGLGLWIRDMASGEVRSLNGTQRGFFPFWSPDGRHIAFFAGGKLRRIEAGGGSALTVCDVTDGRGGSWNTRGTIIYGKSTADGIYAVSDGGGTPRQITAPDTSQGIGDHRFPWFLPDDDHFLFTARGNESAFLCVGALSDGTVRRLIPIRSNGVYADGHVLYVRENTLVARPFDTGKLAFTGDARIVVEPVHRHDGFAHGSFSVSGNGVLLYGEAGDASTDEITVYGRDGRVLDTIASRSEIDDLVASPDGSALAISGFNGEAAGGYDIWTHDLERRVSTRVTFTDEADDPVFSPDATTLVYSAGGDLLSGRASGVGAVDTLFVSNRDDLPVDWSRDGNHILFLSIGSTEDVWVYDTRTRTAEPLLQTDFREMHPQFSPDGAWIAYASDESGQHQVYLIDYPNLTRKIQVSRDGGLAPRWRADGRELYFMAAADSICAVRVDSADGQVDVGEPIGLFGAQVSGARTHQYAVSPDGDAFYMIESGSGADDDAFRVLIGWNVLFDR